MCSISLRVHYLQRLLEIFGVGDLSVLLSFICLFNHLIISEWTHTYFELGVIISCYFLFLLKLFQLRPWKMLSVVSLCCAPRIVVVVFSHFLTFWHCNMSLANLLYFLHQPQNHLVFQGALVLFIGEWNQKLRAGLQVCLLLLGVVSRPFQLTRQKNNKRIQESMYTPTCVCVCVCLHIYCSFLYVSIGTYTKLNMGSYVMSAILIHYHLDHSNFLSLFICNLLNYYIYIRILEQKIDIRSKSRKSEESMGLFNVNKCMQIKMYYYTGNLHTNVHRSISSLIVGYYSILWMKNSENIRKQIFRDNYLGYSSLFFTLFDNVGYSILYPEKKQNKNVGDISRGLCLFILFHFLFFHQYHTALVTVALQ